MNIDITLGIGFFKWNRDTTMDGKRHDTWAGRPRSGCPRVEGHHGKDPAPANPASEILIGGGSPKRIIYKKKGKKKNRHIVYKIEKVTKLVKIKKHNQTKF